MALPTLLKTYQFDTNNRILSSNELQVAQQTMFAIKEIMTGFGTLPWTVAGSGTTLAGGMDATDRWTAYTDLTWNATNRSWIVLERPDGVQFLIDLDISSGTPQQASFRMSVGGLYTGGSAGTPPTATDEIEISNGPQANYWGYCSITGADDIIISAMHSTDGLVTRIFICSSGFIEGCWEFETIINPRTNHSIPVVGSVRGASTSGGDIMGVGNIDATYWRAYEAGAIELLNTTEGRNTGGWLSTLGTASVAEELDGEMFFNELGWYATNTGKRGPKGRRPDVWSGQYQIANTGDTYPSDLTRQFIQMGSLIYPWDGATVLEII